MTYPPEEAPHIVRRRWMLVAMLFFGAMVWACWYKVSRPTPAADKPRMPRVFIMPAPEPDDGPVMPVGPELTDVLETKLPGKLTR